MLRRDALAAIYPELAPCVVVTIMGAVAAELYALGHRPNFFYLEHAMGLASSLGLGIALSRPELTVVVLDGDGSILMNLGSLTTMGRYQPPNLIHIVFDNEVLLSVGQSFTTATATGSDIAAIAAAAGVPRTLKVDTVAACQQAFHAALRAKALTTLVAKIEPEGPTSYLIDVHMLENRFEFQRCLSQM
jgi:sulfopyruvate decarboxylase subunit beta